MGKKKIKQPRFKKGLFPETEENLPSQALDGPLVEEPDDSHSVENVEAREDGCDSETVEEVGRRDSSASVSSVVWMPDESACTCSVCEEPFTMFRRRHHCRACGLIACAECAPRTSGAWPSLLMRPPTTYKRLC